MNWLIKLWAVFVSYMLGRSGKPQTQGTGESGQITTGAPATSETPPTLSLPHPEEPMNPAQTVANMDIGAVMTEWLTQRNVPQENRDYFKNGIEIEVYDAWPPDKIASGTNPNTPAMTWQVGNKRYLACLAKWLNVGVIAHEQAHNSYALLTEDEKAEWKSVYLDIRESDPLIKYLFKINPYGLTNEIEGHAEIGRYIGQSMSESLRKYYPKLF
jgi:hypothetical protein